MYMHRGGNELPILIVRKVSCYLRNPFALHKSLATFYLTPSSKDRAG